MIASTVDKAVGRSGATARGRGTLCLGSGGLESWPWAIAVPSVADGGPLQPATTARKRRKRRRLVRKQDRMATRRGLLGRRRKLSAGYASQCAECTCARRATERGWKSSGVRVRAEAIEGLTLMRASDPQAVLARAYLRGLRTVLYENMIHWNVAFAAASLSRRRSASC